MSYTKPEIYNLALSALLLAKQVVDVDTDKSNEVLVLNTHWKTAFESTLQDLDLESLATPIVLELITPLDNGGPWSFVYKYPNNCAFFRRIVSGYSTDNSSTHISKRVGIYNNQKAIFTNCEEASAEILAKDVPLVVLNPMAAMAVAYKLAFLSAPLITGKGAKSLRESIFQQYVLAKTEAQETDANENFSYESDAVRSEFVAARIS